MNKIIHRVYPCDAPQVFALQEELRIKGEKQSREGRQGGFLVSAFTVEQYAAFAEKCEYFFKVVDQDNHLLGVMLAYDSLHIEREHSSNWLVRETLGTEFILVKQVFVSPRTAKEGIGSMLYRHLINITLDTLPIAAVIVTEPRNEPSISFHHKHGFHTLLPDFVPSAADPDGIAHPRTAMVRMPRQDCPACGQKRHLEKETLDALNSRLMQLITLYRHEDSLNWTKLSLQASILLAAGAGIAFLYSNSDAPKVPLVLFFSFIGTAVNLFFTLTLQSGVRYMNEYKSKIRVIERKLAGYIPYFQDIFHKSEYVAEQSATYRWMVIVSRCATVLWSLFLIGFLVWQASILFSRWWCV